MQQDPAGYMSGSNLYDALSNAPQSRIDPLGLVDGFEWTWHHMLQISVFGDKDRNTRGKNGTPYIHQQGLRLEAGIDPNAMEHGIEIRARDHLPQYPSALHYEEAYGKEARNWIDRWKRNPENRRWLAMNARKTPSR